MEFAPRSPGEAPVSEETVLSILRQATRSDKDVSTIADWLMKVVCNV